MHSKDKSKHFSWPETWSITQAVRQTKNKREDKRKRWKILKLLDNKKEKKIQDLKELESLEKSRFRQEKKTKISNNRCQASNRL